MRRDPFGERPLYYLEASGALRTAPTVARLLADSDAPRALDPAGVAGALCGTLAPERSLFEGVGRVPPGHALVPDPGGPRLVRYWEPPLRPEPDEGVEEGAMRQELLRLLRLAVRSRTSGTEAACTLSGGMDSAAVLALMAEDAAALRAYSLDDDFEAGSEAARASRVAARFGAEHVVVRVSEEALPAHLAETVLACEDLVWNGRAVASYLLFRTIRAAGDAVVLSGAGADEVLCGNPAGLNTFEARLEAEYALARDLLTPEAAAGLGAPAALTPPAGVDPILARQHLFLRTVLPDSTLVPECRASAAVGVEVRLPYLDLDFACFCLRLPLRLRVRGETGKVLLREALRGVLPDELLARPKTPRIAPAGGRSAPARQAWLALYERWLAPGRLEALGVVDPVRAKALLDGFRRMAVEDPRRPVCDAVLLKLTSLSILEDLLLRAGPTGASVRGETPL